MRIISGGQTGADRGALSAAKDLGLQTGGWMPKGYKTEKGPRPELAVMYQVKEHTSPEYAPRTEANVKEADGTIWVGRMGSLGYHCTMRAVIKHHRPYLVNPTAAELRRWIKRYDIRTLNVAGNRESSNPAAFSDAYVLIVETFR